MDRSSSGRKVGKAKGFQINLVAAILEIEELIHLAALGEYKGIASRIACQNIATGPARDQVIAAPAEQKIIARLAAHGAIVAPGKDQV